MIVEGDCLDRQSLLPLEGIMQYTDYFALLVERIHSVIAATVDEQGMPVTCAMDLMDQDAEGLYFLTARGKSLYRRLCRQKYIALTGMLGQDTMSSAALSIRGRVREAGRAYLPRLLEKNPYMYQIYPTEESRAALTVFQIYAGTGEWFDLSKKPIQRDSFVFGNAEGAGRGYLVDAACRGCGACLRVCPQGCIDLLDNRAVIRQENCLHCGACMQVCPAGAIREGIVHAEG